jgi:acetyltransferase
MSDFERRLKLKDGRDILIRPLVNTDSFHLVEGLKQLSPASTYHRFLAYKKEFSPEELARFTNIDQVDHFALAMGVIHPDGEKGIGVARAFRDNDDPERAELGIVIIDAFQRQGLGRFFFDAMLDYLKEKKSGFRLLYGDLDASNTGMIKLLSKYPQTVLKVKGSGILSMRLKL